MKKLRWFLLPCDRSKRPLLSNGEHGASNDPDVLAAWKKRWPDCNWAIATGPSELIAVDMDAYKPSFDAAHCVDRFGVLPATVSWNTARGGATCIYRRPEGLVVTSRNGMLPAVDVKASTGYVLIPPSCNEAGQKYEWVNRPSECEIADASPRLLKFLAEYKPDARRLGKAEGRDEVYLSAGDGRWEYLRRLGGMMRRMGCGYDTMVDALKAFVEFQCEYDDTLRHSEIERLATWLSSIPFDDSFADDNKEKEP